MKLLGKRLEKDNSGSVSLVPEDSEDMWHLYNLILCEDEIKASTVRYCRHFINQYTVDEAVITQTRSE
jgi:protein pelota